MLLSKAVSSSEYTNNNPPKLFQSKFGYEKLYLKEFYGIRRHLKLISRKRDFYSFLYTFSLLRSIHKYS